MGTRSLTIVENEQGQPVVTIYRQFDGHPDTHGRELAKFLNGFSIVNGISDFSKPKQANGAECLAAQIVAHLKRPRTMLGKRTWPVGNVYIYPNGSRKVGEQFIYTVRVVAGETPRIEVLSCYEHKTIALGTPKEVQQQIRNMLRRKEAE